MKVTVKEYLEGSNELLCIIEDQESDPITVDPFTTKAIETTETDFQEVGRSLVDKTFEMSDYLFDTDEVYLPNVFKEIEPESFQKTQPCPICGTHLITPKDYFPALHKMKEEVGKYRDVIIEDYKIGNEREISFEDFVKHSNREKGEFPLDLKISIGTKYHRKDGKVGRLVMFDVDENQVAVYVGDGFYWYGTGQEFREQWK